jgi:hypothetical protein
MQNMKLKIRQVLLGRILLGLAVGSSTLLTPAAVLAAPQEITPAESTDSNTQTESDKSTDAKQSTEASNSTEVDPAKGNSAEVNSATELGLLDTTDDAKASSEPSSSEASEKASESESADAAKELNVPPKNVVPLYEKDRPEWLFKAPTIEDGKLVLYVGGELLSHESECEKKQPASMYAEVCQYFDNEVFHEQDATSRTPLTGELIANRWVDAKENYVAKVQTSEGTMYQLWSIVRIDDEGLKNIKAWHLSTVQPTRIRSLGFGLIGILSGISLIHLGARFTAGRAKKKS